jgi:predicted MPP superfamily phosphohydrolase
VVEPSSLTTRQYELAIPSWSKDLAGLRVAVLADLHVGSRFNGLSKLERIVELTNSLKPDLILIPGDFAIDGVIGGSFVSPEEAAAVLGRLTAPLGVWACLGNHDWWLDPRRVGRALQGQGIRLLEDDAVRSAARNIRARTSSGHVAQRAALSAVRSCRRRHCRV